MYVWRGNPQCHCHRLNSIYFIVLRNTVHHLILGSQLILWELLTLHLQRFLTGSHSSSVACWDWSHRHITRPNQPWCDGRKVWSGCNKVRDSAPLLLTHVAPLKTVHGQVFVEWFGLADNCICRRAKWGNQVIKDPMVQLKIGPTSRKGCHRDACVVLDATDTSVSTHHFIPGL